MLFQKTKIFFSISAVLLCMGVCVYMDTTLLLTIYIDLAKAKGKTPVNKFIIYFKQ